MMKRRLCFVYSVVQCTTLRFATNICTRQLHRKVIKRKHHTSMHACSLKVIGEKAACLTCLFLCCATLLGLALLDVWILARAPLDALRAN